MAKLGDPIVVKGVWLRNRLVLPPITTSYGTTQGEVTDRVLGFYRQRSRDVGMVVVEATVVRADGRLVPRSLGLWHDGQIPGMARLARTIKGEGAAAVVQIAHAGARSVPVDEGICRPSPSSVRLAPGPEPTVLRQEQVSDLVEDFVAAVARAAEAGFDGVELHGAHHYLISQFLSPLTNYREDRYGGDAAGRSTFALDVVRAIRHRLGDSYPLLFRFNAVELLEGGQSIEEGIVVARLLESAGIDVLHSSLLAQGGWRESRGEHYLATTSALPKEQPLGTALPYAGRIRAAVGIPVIAVGKLWSSAVAERTIGEGQADLVAVGRQMIIDPEAAAKIMAGRDSEIVRCQECNVCFGSIRRDTGLVCDVNKNPAGPAEY